MITDERKNTFSVTIYMHGNSRTIGEIEKYLQDTYPEYGEYEIYYLRVESGLPKGDYGQTLHVGFLKRPAVKDRKKDSRTFVIGP